MKKYHTLSELYSINIKEYTVLSVKYRKQLQWLMIARLLAFILFMFFIVKSIMLQFDNIFVIGSFVFFILFLQLVRIYNKTSEKHIYYKNLVLINQNELKALEFDFSPFESGTKYIDAAHPYAYDIDLFGTGSVFQQLNRTISVYGEKKLACWLSDIRIDTREIEERQEAVKELSEMVFLRQDFIARGMSVKEKEKQRENLITWANHKITFREKIFYKTSSILLSIISPVTIFLAAAGILPFSVIFFILTLSTLLIILKIRKINKEHARVSKQFDIISRYSFQLEIIENTSFKSSKLIKLQDSIKSEIISSKKALKKLASIINAFDYRLNLFIATILNGFFLWDFICMIRLNKWKTKYGYKLVQWFEVFNEFDALQSIANYYYNNPEYCFAAIDDSGPVIKAKNLCHPQIPYEVRVNNDIDVSKPGEFLIITGPNMAGKSTYLRTVALSIVMGQSGAPVCAGSFRCRRLTLFTSMRTSDSLYKNESYFFAELKRLKEIIEASNIHKNIFIVLDEILKGTNSKDKAEGSKAFLKKIAGSGATGMVATHDLTLGELETEMKGNIHNYCFEADTEGKDVTFDYKLRKGITTKMNASVLMKQMGIT